MGAEILPFNQFPDCPVNLKDAGKQAWSLGRDLWVDGSLTKRDIPAWTMYCEAFDELAHCDAVAERDGEYMLSSQGTVSEHPALRRRRATESKILRYQRLFGLVPDARKKRPAAQQGVATRQR